MTDTLIARLRDANLFADRVEAADRIEAMTAEIEWLTKANVEHMEARVELRKEVEQVTAFKDGAYLERNKLVALLSKVFPSGKKKTAIEGWSEDWHGCVYIDLPTGQASWHYHDSQSDLFAHLPEYQGTWDGHTTDEKYERISQFAAEARLTSLEVELSEVDKITNRVRLENAKLRAEIGIGGKALKKCMDELQEMIVCRNAAGDAVFDLKAENARIGIDAAKEIVKLRTHITALEKQEPVEKIEERSADYWASKFPVPLGYKLVKETWESSPPLSQDNPDFIVNPVEYQYAYPDGTWRCSNGDRINGMKPTASRALYATRNSS